jgi:hypothetical protein
MQQDYQFNYSGTPEFWVTTGLSIYVVINLPIFLFYNALSAQFEKFAIDIWNIHNLSYLILAVFLAKSFYVSSNT